MLEMNSVKRITLVMRNVPVNYDTKHNSYDKRGKYCMDGTDYWFGGT